MKSASTKPTARSIARLGVCFRPSTTAREWRRVSTSEVFLRMPGSLRNAIALDQVPIDAAQRLRLGADASPRAIFGIPRIQIDVQPGRVGDETLQEKRSEDGACERRGCNIV